MKTSWEVLGLAITAASSILGTYLVGWWKYRQMRLELKTRKEQDKAHMNGAILSVEGLKSQVDVARKMQHISDLGYGRVLILLVQNDGKIPRPGSRLYAHAINPISTDLSAAREISNRYDGVQVDTDYIQFCAMLAADNQYVHRITVPEDGDLNNLTLIQGWYQSEGVAESDVYHLATDVYFDEKSKKEHFRMYILSVAVYRHQNIKIDDINPQETERLVSMIRKQYNKFYRH